jgi:hypothetical protein
MFGRNISAGGRSKRNDAAIGKPALQIGQARLGNMDGYVRSMSTGISVSRNRNYRSGTFRASLRETRVVWNL